MVHFVLQFQNIQFPLLKNDLPRLPAWPKISWRVSSGPMPSKRPIAQGFSQLVRSSENSSIFFGILKQILRPTYKSNLQLTRTQGLWLDTLRHTMNTIWYDKISPHEKKLIWSSFVDVYGHNEGCLTTIFMFLPFKTFKFKVAYLTNMPSIPI